MSRGNGDRFLTLYNRKRDEHCHLMSLHQPDGTGLAEWLRVGKGYYPIRADHDDTHNLWLGFLHDGRLKPGSNKGKIPWPRWVRYRNYKMARVEMSPSFHRKDQIHKLTGFNPGVLFDEDGNKGNWTPPCDKEHKGWEYEVTSWKRIGGEFRPDTIVVKHFWCGGVPDSPKPVIDKLRGKTTYKITSIRTVDQEPPPFPKRLAPGTKMSVTDFRYFGDKRDPVVLNQTSNEWPEKTLKRKLDALF